MSTNNGSTVYRYFYKRTLGPEPNRSEQIHHPAHLLYAIHCFLIALKKKEKEDINISICITNVTVISPPKHSAAICAGSNGFTSASLNRNH